MFSIPYRYIRLTGYAIVLAILASVFLSATHARQKATVTRALEDHFSLSRSTLLSLAEFTARNDAPKEIEDLIRDCPVRAEYETMLNNLHSNLSASEIQRATGLYDACGDFFALRKRLVVMRMQSVFAELVAYADLYEAYTQSDRYTGYLRTAWKPIIDREVERKDLLSEQVALQGVLIRSLSARQKQELETRLLHAQEIAESLDVKAQQLEELRKGEASHWSSLAL